MSYLRVVSFCGQIISVDGYQMDPKATEVVITLEKVKATTIGEVRKIMEINAKPLYDLLNGTINQNLMQKKHHKELQPSTTLKFSPIRWTRDTLRF